MQFARFASDARVKRTAENDERPPDNNRKHKQLVHNFDYFDYMYIKCMTLILSFSIKYLLLVTQVIQKFKNFVPRA